MPEDPPTNSDISAPANVGVGQTPSETAESLNLARLPLEAPLTPEPSHNPQLLPGLPNRSHENSSLRNPDLLDPSEVRKALERLSWLEPLRAELVALPHGSRQRRVRQAALAHGLRPRTVWRYLHLLERSDGAALELARKRRADLGQARLPEDLLRLVMTLWLMHPKYSARRIRRIIELNDPALLDYRPYPKSLASNILSPGTVQRVRCRMEERPEFRVALMDDKARKEFGRVWVGEVLAERANELWMVDMTRCDTFVYDPYSDGILRLRIHAAIDVFSGAVPGFVFSREEGQASTDRMLMLSLLEKPSEGGWDTRWPVWGRPETIYWDNGKVYRSGKSEQIAESLGIRLEHSLPRVSHSRGNIERFFGTFHQTFEKQWPSYAGADTTERDHQRLARLLANTRRWFAEGGPDPLDTGDRMPTEEEFKQAALLWLTMDYHQTVLKGSQTRQELFLSSAPRGSWVRFNFGDLNLLFSRRERRTVRGNGTVHFGNRPWGLADGSLVAHQGREIVILVNELMPSGELVAALPLGDRLQVLGPLVSMSLAALGDEARAIRRRMKQQAKSILQAAEEIRRAFTDPTWRHDRVLQAKSGLEPAAPETQVYHLAHPEARLQTDPLEAQRLELEAAAREMQEAGIELESNVDDWFNQP